MTKLFICADTEEYPISEHDIRRRNPNTSFGITIDVEDAIALGFLPVKAVTRPAGDVVTEGTPTLVEGVWSQTWIVRPYTPEEVKANAVAAANGIRENSIEGGISWTFPGDIVDTVKVLDRDIILLNSIRQMATSNLDNPEYVQPFRSLTNQMYLLSAQDVIDLTTHIFLEYQLLYVASWTVKDEVPGEEIEV